MRPIVAETEISVAANASNANVLDNTDLERAPRGGVLTLLLTGSAAGLRASLSVGQDKIFEDLIVNTQNRSPVVPDDAIIGDVEVREGQTVKLRINNTTAGALTARARAILE